MWNKRLLHSVVHTAFRSSRHLSITFGAPFTAGIELDPMGGEGHRLKNTLIFFLSGHVTKHTS